MNDKFQYQYWSEVNGEDYARIIGYIESFAQEEPERQMTSKDISNAMLYAYYVGTLRGAEDQRAEIIKGEASDWWNTFDPADWDAPVED